MNYRIDTQNYLTCNLLRRFAAIFYDLLLLSTMLFFATLIILPFTNGNAIISGNIPYNIYLLGLCYLYFSWHWIHGGQTPGMRVWNIRLRAFNSGRITWKIASLRFISAIISLMLFGAGFFWSLLDHRKFALHDYCSGSYPFKVT